MDVKTAEQEIHVLTPRRYERSNGEAVKQNNLVVYERPVQSREWRIKQYGEIEMLIKFGKVRGEVSGLD